MIARAEDCFEGLSPREDSSSLPSISTLSEKGIAAALGVGVASAGGDAKEGQSFVLQFTDVKVQKVSLLQLRTSFRKNVAECQQVRPLIDASYTAISESMPKKASKKPAHQVEELSKTITAQQGTIVSDRSPPLLLGTVFTARRIIRVESSLDAKARLTFAQKLIDRLGLGDSFQVSASADEEPVRLSILKQKMLFRLHSLPPSLSNNRSNLQMEQSNMK